MEKFILWGKYCENPLHERIPFRDEHLERLSKLKRDGILISLGPTKCNRFVFGVFQINSEKDLREIVEDDIYWREGIWTDFSIYNWNQVF